MEYKEYLIKLSKPLEECIETLNNLGNLSYLSTVIPTMIGLKTYVIKEHLLPYDCIESVEDMNGNYGELL